MYVKCEYFKIWDGVCVAIFRAQSNTGYSDQRTLEYIVIVLCMYVIYVVYGTVLYLLRDIGIFLASGARACTQSAAEPEYTRAARREREREAGRVEHNDESLRTKYFRV